MERSAAVLERDHPVGEGGLTSSPRRRIAMMLESDGPGGAEVMILRLSEELRRRGHWVLPVGPPHATGWLGARFREIGFEQEHFQIHSPIDPGCVRGLMALFRRHRIDAVHSHEFTMAVYGGLATRLLGLPHVITMHGSSTVCRAMRRRVALRWALRAADRAVVVSAGTRRQFAHDVGLAETLFTVVPNGVPRHHGNAEPIRREFGLTSDEVVLLAVGSLEPRKGHRLLIQALAMLRADGLSVPWRLIIAGGRGGESHAELLALVRDTGLEGRVHIVTHRDDVPDLLAAAEVFVMPSLWEGLPMAMLEAMTAGKAVVASATSGIPEAMVHRRQGLLVPPGDVPALAEALRVLLTDPVRRALLGAAAARRAQREFSVQLMATRYELLYNQAGHHPAGEVALA